jgi:hypothetical protein
VEIRESRVEDLEVSVVDVLKYLRKPYERWSLADWISHTVQELDDVGTALEIIENTHFSVDLALLDWFENLYHAWGLSVNVGA